MDVILQILQDNAGTLISVIIGGLVSFAGAWVLKGKNAMKEFRDVLDAMIIMVEDDNVSKEEIGVLMKEVKDLVSVFKPKELVEKVSSK